MTPPAGRPMWMGELSQGHTPRRRETGSDWWEQLSDRLFNLRWSALNANASTKHWMDSTSDRRVYIYIYIVYICLKKHISILNLEYIKNTFTWRRWGNEFDWKNGTQDQLERGEGRVEIMKLYYLYVKILQKLKNVSKRINKCLLSISQINKNNTVNSCHHFCRKTFFFLGCSFRTKRFNNKINWHIIRTCIGLEQASECLK